VPVGFVSRVHGTETVDGRELIRLVQVPVDLLPPAPGSGDRRRDGDSAVTFTVPDSPATTAPPATTSLDPDTFEYVEHIYLVDAETFRPVRIIGYPGEAADHSDAMYVSTIEYLPRTAETMALLVPSVPEGYDLVADLRGDDERYDECGW